MYVIGLDIGTSGVKSTLFDMQANVVCNAYEEYDLISDAPGHYELNPAELLEKSIAVIARSMQKVDATKVRAICLTSFAESFVCMDEQKQVLANTMIYMDRRGEQECAEFVAQFGEDTVYSIGMQPIESMFACYKLRWMSKNKPQVLRQTKKLSFIADFVAYALGAEHVCDYSLCARSAMFDVRAKQWWADGVRFAGIDPAVLPKPVPSGSAAGQVDDAAASKTGLSAGTLIVIGGHDQVLAAVGCGITKQGDIANGMGTVDCVTTLLGEASIDIPLMKRYGLPLIPYIQEGSYMTSAFNKSGGSVIKWFRDTMAKDLKNDANAFEKLNMEMPAEPTNLLMLPYLAGGATPESDDDMPAAFFGATLHTSRGDWMRGMMEGEAYVMKRCLQCFDGFKDEDGKFVVVGGGSKSDTWMQIKANVFDRRIDIPVNQEAGTLASAMLCYVNLGLVGSLQEAQDRFVLTNKSFVPNEKVAEVYARKYNQFIRARKLAAKIQEEVEEANERI